MASGAELALAVTGQDPTAAAAGHARPAFSAAPTAPPQTQRRHHVCTVTGTAPPVQASGHGLVWLRRHPTGVTVVWYPGLNSKRCHAQLTHRGRHAARKIVAGIDAAPRVKRGMYSCPMDDGTRLGLYVTYRGRTEYVGLALTGCRTVSAPHRSARWQSNPANRVLGRQAPKPWRRYLRTR
jgi:hypothetical protein